ncbi:uncharacterized protein [Diabrotica undecimpunctata]|uniref:uncharacterized protein isoform X3 n=1 Tax=Diabrotica undecimpunctata TaxID=50387 RepID=UPI003B638C16
MESVYPAGMLDRDQRTAKIRLCQCRCSDMEVPNRTNSFTTDASTKISSIFSSIVFNKKRTKFSYLIWKKGYLIHTYNFPRVKNVVLVLVYLTLTMMNPASTAPAHDEVQEDKWWEKPCGSVEPSDPLPTSPPEIFFKWHLSDLLVQAEYNLIQANHLKDSFTGNYDGVGQDRKPYAWLGWITRWRVVFESLMQPRQRLADTFFILSKCAAAMKLRGIDEDKFEYAFLFKSAFYDIRQLLCQLHYALKVSIKDKSPHKNPYTYIPKEDLAILTEDQRDERTIRDYAFYRYYLQTMESIFELFKFYVTCVKGGVIPGTLDDVVEEILRKKKKKF